MKGSYNINLLIIVLSGYLFISYLHLILFLIPIVLTSALYFILVSLLLNKRGFAMFALLSLVFVSFYFSFLTYKKISPQLILLSLQKETLPIFLYSFLLLPLVFLSYTIDFYLLTNEIASLNKNKIVYFVIPVLIKRELIFHRFRKIMETFEAKGLNTKSFFSKYYLASKWIVPLAITTLMEGVESYEFNKMLRTNIFNYSPSNKVFYFSIKQKVILVIIVLLFILRILLCL